MKTVFFKMFAKPLDPGFFNFYSGCVNPDHTYEIKGDNYIYYYSDSSAIKGTTTIVTNTSNTLSTYLFKS